MTEQLGRQHESSYGDIVVPPCPPANRPIQEVDYWRMPDLESYTLPAARKHIEAQLSQLLGVDIELEKPPEHVNSDYAVKLFAALKKHGGEVADTLAGLPADWLHEAGIAEARQEGPYLNVRLDAERVGTSIVRDIEANGSKYGELNIGDGATVVLDTSSPNIAKEMTVAHLRSTVIGESLARLYQNCGYRVIRDNHLGDWGTQFGILGRAYELWGNEVPELQDDPIKGLLKLYVRMNQAIEEESGGDDGESDLKQQGLEWFRRLENGDPAARELWQWALNISLVEANRLYERLGSNFEYILGESQYVGMLPSVLSAMERSGLAGRDDKGRTVIDLTDEKLGQLPIQKSDGTSLYATRDLATLAARTAWFNPDRIIYVVGGEQQHYFRQVFKVFEKYSKMTGEQPPETEHVYFGMVKLPEGKMSTRKGNIIFLEEVIDEAVSRARKIVAEHAASDNLEFTDDEIDEIAEKVGVGAVIYSELRQGRTRNIDFDWDEVLSFSGNSGPYIQYTNARINALFRRLEPDYQVDFDKPLTLAGEMESGLALKLGEFPDAIRSAAEKNEPSLIAEYLYELSSVFNSFYKNHPVLNAESKDVKDTRLRLSDATATVLRRGMHLLGLPIPEKM